MRILLSVPVVLGCASAPQPAPAVVPPPGFPTVQVVPQPGDQISVEVLGREVLRYHFGRDTPKPYVFPIIGPSGRPVLRLGHPRDPAGHAHHLGLWIGHQKVAGHNFWEHMRSPARIVHDRIARLEDGPRGIIVIGARWLDGEGRAVLLDERTLTVTPVPGSIDHTGYGELYVDLDVVLRPAEAAPVALDQSNFGLLGVRVAKTMGARDGGGVITNSERRTGEKELMPHRRARWCDYSGAAAPGRIDGVALFDHPRNPGHPTFFHVRDDGWMGAAVTQAAALEVTAERPLRVRYRLWIHAGPADPARLDREWELWSRS